MTYIANQEAEHFMSWYHRLQDLGYPFGTFPLNKGLWQSAGETSGKGQRVLLGVGKDLIWCRI
jgi:uncharacterized ferritin-like protein (DUF455 family)